MESDAGGSSVSSSSPRISLIARLRHARQVHERLQARKWTERNPRCSVRVDQDAATHQRLLPAETGHLHRTPPPSSVESLATELQTLLRCRQQQGKPMTESLLQRVEKIGAHEKNALVVHLLQQAAFFQAQRNDVVAVGEKLTTQLVQQQHELRVQFKTQTAALQQQLEQATHHHPEVTRLEEQVVQLHELNRLSEQKLLFAVQKLQRSRQRERALRLENESEPLLWDL